MALTIPLYEYYGDYFIAISASQACKSDRVRNGASAASTTANPVVQIDV
jgi:hypothetical protein